MSRYRQAGAALADHTFSVPLDHDRPEGERIEIFAREMAPADQASASLPWLLFLQGGPGFGAPRPACAPAAAPCSTACSPWPAARPDGTEGIPKVTGADSLGVAVAPPAG
jgi:hypothetical protein